MREQRNELKFQVVSDNGPAKARAKFLRFFHDGFQDPQYLSWERNYKWEAHQKWDATLNEEIFRDLMRQNDFKEICARAVRIESRTNLLFSFEKMALRDAVKSARGAKIFSSGLYQFLHGGGQLETRFDFWRDSIEQLPRKQTRVLTWPLVTVFGFIAQPNRHCFLKPKVTKRAAVNYSYDFKYVSRPNFETYKNYLNFCTTIKNDMRSLNPRDLIDIQSFLWVQGSDEY